jgi:WD40 repeat protein
VLAGTDEGIQRLRLADGSSVDTIDVLQVRSIDYDENEDLCAVCTVLGYVGILNMSAPNESSLIRTGRTLTAVIRLNAAAGTWICASDDGCLLFSKGETDLTALRLMSQSIEAIALSPDTRILAAGGVDGVIGCLDIDTKRGTMQFEGHDETVRCLQFHPEGGLLASAGDDTTVRLWDLASKAERRRFAGHVGRVQAMAFSPDGDWLATGDSSGCICLWDIFGDRHETIQSPHGEISALVFDKLGGVLISGHREGVVDAWDLMWRLDASEESHRRCTDNAERREEARPRPRS